MNNGSPSKVFVSFCMSTYKRPHLLKTTLHAILKQTFSNFEVVISDNDPEGSASQVVQNLGDSRIKYFWNGENIGMIKSFNQSIHRSEGDYIVMITDDDPVYPEMLETLVNLRDQYPDYGIYFGGCDWVCTNKVVAKLYNLRIGTNSCLSDYRNLNDIETFTAEEFLKNLFQGKLFRHNLWSTCMVRKELLINMGGLPDYGTPNLSDYAYLSIVGSYLGCVIINKSLGCQTLHEQNFSLSHEEQIVMAVRIFPSFIDQKISHMAEWPIIKKMMIRFVALWAISLMAFLGNYYEETKQDNAKLIRMEREIFRIGFMKKYRIKFFLKKKFPFLHDIIVHAKRIIIK